MVGEFLQKVFVHIYVPLLLSLTFWGLSLIGLGVLGIGPAWATINDQFAENQFNYRNYSFRKFWTIYKAKFWKNNGEFWLLSSLIAFLSYELILSQQINWAFIFFFQVLITAVILFLFLLELNVFLLQGYFEVSFKDAVLIGTTRIFSSFAQLLFLIIGFLVLAGLTALWPGWILFLTPGGMLWWLDYRQKKWINQLNEI